MSGLKITETPSVLTLGPTRFAVKYSELLCRDGVTVQGPVAVELEPYRIFAQLGSLDVSAAYAKISGTISKFSKCFEISLTILE